MTNLLKPYQSRLVNKEEREKALNKTKDILKESIVFEELDIRFLERQKLKSKDINLTTIQDAINNKKQLLKAYDDKLELVLDELAGK